MPSFARLPRGAYVCELPECREVGDVALLVGGTNAGYFKPIRLGVPISMHPKLQEPVERIYPTRFDSIELETYVPYRFVAKRDGRPFWIYFLNGDMQDHVPTAYFQTGGFDGFRVFYPNGRVVDVDADGNVTEVLRVDNDVSE